MVLATYIYFDSNTNRAPDIAVQGEFHFPGTLRLSSGYQDGGFGGPNPPVTYEKVSEESVAFRGSNDIQELNSLYLVVVFKKV